MNSELAIEVTGLEKRYGPDTVLGGIDLAVSPGTITSCSSQLVSTAQTVSRGA